jgi:hypothetical protein
MNDMIKTTPDLQGKQVRVKVPGPGKKFMIGKVLGEDRVFKNTYLIGITELSWAATKPNGKPLVRQANGLFSVYRGGRKSFELI